MAHRLQQGSIIWANVADPQGRNAKDRPAVILTPNEEIEAGEALFVVIATSVFDEPLTEMQVKLPWHRNRHPKTGLYKPCVVLCDWLTELPKTSILDVGGVVPGGVLRDILSKVQSLDGDSESVE